MAGLEKFRFTIARFADVAAADLLEKACGKPFVAALIYTPDACHVARIDGSAFQIFEPYDTAPKPADLSRAYEVRAFGVDAELRWIRDGELGEATLICDGELTSAEVPAGVTAEPPAAAIAILPRTYWLWGEASAKQPSHEGWLALAAPRIGTRFVPFTGAAKALVLKAQEYVVQHASGNAVVLFERLAAFDAVVVPKQPEVGAA